MNIQDFIKDVPKIPEGDIEVSKEMFKDYIFFKKCDNKGNVKEYYCTACKEKYVLSFPAKTYTSDELEIYGVKHKEYCRCPKCGRTSECININIKKNIRDLKIEAAVAFVLPVSFDEVYIRCVFITKHFLYGHVGWNLHDYELYHFVKSKEPEYLRARYWYDDYIAPKFREPFGMSSSAYGFTWFDYNFIGIERFNETFFKYSAISDLDQNGFARGSCFKYFALFSQHPRQIEMLYKMGYLSLIEDMLHDRGVKRILNLEAKSPKKFFRLSRDELKAWEVYGQKNSETLRMYLKLFRGAKNVNDGIQLGRYVANVIGTYYADDIKRISKELCVSALDIVKYIKKSESLFYIFKDYLDAAKEIGYDLSVHNVAFPKKLKKAHDEAIKIRKIKANEMENASAKKRYSELSKTYSLDYGDYLIRPPKNSDEIVAEGIALSHCVGGYAARHAAGKTTILFMRSKDNPDMPLYTIEMHGKTLRQVHGKNNIAKPADCPEAKQFFDMWLAWVQDGSKKKAKEKIMSQARVACDV